MEPETSTRVLIWPVLSAFLFGPLGLHRALAGRFQSGLFMFALTCLALYAFQLDDTLVERIKAGEVPGQIPARLAMASVILFVNTIWSSVDGIRLVAGRFRDEKELQIKRWW